MDVKIGKKGNPPIAVQTAYSVGDEVWFLLRGEAKQGTVTLVDVSVDSARSVVVYNVEYDDGNQPSSAYFREEDLKYSEEDIIINL